MHNVHTHDEHAMHAHRIDAITHTHAHLLPAITEKQRSSQEITRIPVSHIVACRAHECDKISVARACDDVDGGDLDACVMCE